MQDKDLVLYFRNTCSYCLRVKRFIDDNAVNITLKNLSEDAVYAEELLESGGKVQVPCLFIDGVAMYESQDIINWLEENVVNA